MSEEQKIWAILFIALFGGNLTGLTGILGNHSSREGHEELQRQIDEIKASDTQLEDKYHAHSHEAPPRWVREKLVSIEEDIKKALKHDNDHNTEAEMWKRRIVSLEAQQRRMQ